jgi:hypothetical protein
VAAALIALAGCGGGGGGAGTTTSTTAAAVTTSAAAAASTGSIVNTTATTVHSVTTVSTRSSNEQQSGDEVPISTQALFTGRGGKITPAKIEVPPFIAVTVVLKSADGKTYSIQTRNHGIVTNGTAQVKLAGLRAGDRYVFATKGATPAKLIIEANAEPGP